MSNRVAENRDTSAASCGHDIIRFLGNTQAYSETTRSVEFKETHLSCVFLTDDFVYKLKKPLAYDFLDFSSPEARLHNCETEVRINSELAPDVYLGVLTLSRNAEGLNLEGRGDPLDYLVKMRRLSDRCNLENLIDDDAVVDEEVIRVARKLADFYVGREPDGPVEVDRYLTEIEGRRKELAGLPVEAGEDLERLAQSLSTSLESERATLSRRHRVDVHGDLRPEHVYLCEEPVFIDRLEFNAELRLMDPLEELAFFAMECDRLGAGWIGRRFIDVYRERSQDPAPAALLAIYQGYRALLWAVLAARHLERGDQRKPWGMITRDYLQRGLKALGESPVGD